MLVRTVTERVVPHLPQRAGIAGRGGVIEHVAP